MYPYLRIKIKTKSAKSYSGTRKLALAINFTLCFSSYLRQSSILIFSKFLSNILNLLHNTLHSHLNLYTRLSCRFSRILINTRKTPSCLSSINIGLIRTFFQWYSQRSRSFKWLIMNYSVSTRTYKYFLLNVLQYLQFSRALIITCVL